MTDLDGLQPNERGLLLVVDPRGGTAVLAGGYFLESLMGQEELDLVLKSAAKDFSRADYPAALRTITAELGGLLKRVAREALRNPRRWPVELPAAVPAGFPPLVRTGRFPCRNPCPKHPLWSRNGLPRRWFRLHCRRAPRRPNPLRCQAGQP